MAHQHLSVIAMTALAISCRSVPSQRDPIARSGNEGAWRDYRVDFDVHTATVRSTLVEATPRGTIWEYDTQTRRGVPIRLQLRIASGDLVDGLFQLGTGSVRPIGPAHGARWMPDSARSMATESIRIAGTTMIAKRVRGTPASPVSTADGWLDVKTGELLKAEIKGASPLVTIERTGQGSAVAPSQLVVDRLALLGSLSCDDKCGIQFGICVAGAVSNLKFGWPWGVVVSVGTLAYCGWQVDDCLDACGSPPTAPACVNPSRCDSTHPCCPTHWCDAPAIGRGSHLCRPKFGPGSQPR